MGMSASQVRLMSLTARLSDLEFSAQQICNARTRNAVETENLSKDYLAALDAKKLTIVSGYGTNGPTYQDLTYSALMTPGQSLSSQYCLSDNYGRVLISQNMEKSYLDANGAPVDLNQFLINNGQNDGPNSPDYQYYKNLYENISQGYITMPEEDATINNSDWLYDSLNNGSLVLQAFDSKDNTWNTVSWKTTTDIIEEDDESQTAMVKAKYESDLASLSSKDKELELDLKRIDTEHNAVQTEYDSVKQVIDKNVETSFKSFG